MHAHCYSAYLLPSSLRFQKIHKQFSIYHDNRLLTANDYRDKLKIVYVFFESVMMKEADKLSNNGRALIRKIQSTLQTLTLMTSDILSYISISADQKHMEVISLDQVVQDVKNDLEEKLVNA